MVFPARTFFLPGTVVMNIERLQDVAGDSVAML